MANRATGPVKRLYVTWAVYIRLDSRRAAQGRLLPAPAEP
jgi:hypothetical protein